MLRTKEGYNVDDRVLQGLLTVPKFHHGSRSIQQILWMCKLYQRQRFVPASLPAEHQLELHVDTKDFFHCMNTPVV
ncbi:hypothetical protein BDV40DRAFT_282145 [Aspergillus tamarii]|uniref:Uncharacterized protein n=1 Tax=Aspergillus tamarii TaxID=41984 RepID=A0A5N6UC11_ASPTM|nr:hypothetical protein BDV40DRAFT_282145 [Aspergillus tamarii]